MSSNAERLVEFGVPVDAVQGLVNETLAGHAQAAASPQGQWLAKNQAALQGYLQAHPDVAGAFGRMAQADSLGAVEYLALRYERDGGAPPPAASGGTIDFGPTPWGDSRYAAPGQAAVHSFDRSRAEEQAYIKRRLRGIIDEGWLNQ